MNILLLSMPDSFEHTPTVSIRMPNGALTSLAGNVDPQHRIAIADLILVQSSVRATLEDLVKNNQPDLVGLSIMTFQRKTAKKSSSYCVRSGQAFESSWAVMIRAWRPKPIPTSSAAWLTLLCAAKARSLFASCCGPSKPMAAMSEFWVCPSERNGRFQHNPDRPVSGLDDGEIRRPNRDAARPQRLHDAGPPGGRR